MIALGFSRDPYSRYGGYQDGPLGGAAPKNQFGKLVVRNDNQNSNDNQDVAELVNDGESANANAQRAVKSKSNEKYAINSGYGGYDGYSSGGYKSAGNYNTDTDDDTSDTDSGTDSDGSDSDSDKEKY